MDGRGRGRGDNNRGRGRGFGGGRGGGSDGGRGGGGFNGGRSGDFTGGRGCYDGGRGGNSVGRGGYHGGRGGYDGRRGGHSGGRGGYDGGRGGYDGGRGGYEGGRGGYSGGRGNQQFHQQSQQQYQYGQGSNQRGNTGPMSVGRGDPSVRPVTGEGSSSSQRKSTVGDEYAAKIRQLSSHSSDDRGLSMIQSLKLSGETSQTTNTEERVAVRRPDEGGVAKIREVNILVNHFRVEYDPNQTIRHYDIDIKPEVAPTKGRPVKISKANLSLVMEKLYADNPSFPLQKTAFDGEKNIFSAVELPTGKFTVRLSPEKDVRCHTYTFSVTLVNELKLHKLKDYLTGELLQLPREVLQGIDVVMKENPRRNLVSIGKSFHPVDPKPKDPQLHYGLVVSEGFQHSLKPTSQGLALCLDYSVLAVRKRLPVLQYLMEYFDLTEVRSDIFRTKRREIEGALRGLKVSVTHRRSKQKYVISALTDQNARDICFTVDDPNGKLPPPSVRLLDYFREKYPQLNIVHGDMPCLSLGKGKRANFVPIELCVLVEGQRFPKENLDRDSAVLLKNMSLVSPSNRSAKICNMLRHGHGPAGGEVSSNFGIDVEMNMTHVKGRVIEPPILKLRSSHNEVIDVNVDRGSCQWNLVGKQVVEGTSLDRWAVVDFTCSERRPNDRFNYEFISRFIARCQKLGMHMVEPLFIEQARMIDLSSAESVYHLFERVHDKAQKNLQLVLCVMSRKDNGYKYIKWVSETKFGIVTQCCLSFMANKMQDQYLAQLGLKVNGKLGGSNVELIKQSLFQVADHVMLIGADVNHPRPLDFGSPSVAAVVASMNWPAANKYISRVYPQGHRVEEIKDFGLICLELIECYKELNGVRPQKLVIFRDGVSEGQFDMVLNSELLHLDNALRKLVDYSPTITLIVAQKRHQTRLFPESPRDAGKNGNIPPGTVVDTTIVHPWEFDFYLCSHYGSIGTSKPTHYHILWDEHGFSSDMWQKFIYDLCFTFARCCKPISLVPPVYYADLSAYRGRLHYDAQSEGQYSSANSSSSSATSSSTSATLSENVLHTDILNFMYFL